MKMKGWSILLAAALWWPLAARAELIHIDLSEVFAAPGGNWNIIADADRNSTVGSLIDFNTGLPTGVSYSGSGWGGSNGAPANWIGGDLDWVDGDAASDIFFSNTGGSITISGLSGSLYSIELVSSENSFGQIVDISIGGAFADRTFNGSGDSDDWDTRLDGYLPADWVIWDSVTPVSGGITIDFSLVGGTFISANALRIAEVPEPHALLLILVGAVAVGGYRSFRRRAKQAAT